MELEPNLDNDWVQQILEDSEIIPPRFFEWQHEQDISVMNLVPQQRFYSLVWKYHSNFKRWPPEELWESFLEQAKNE